MVAAVGFTELSWTETTKFYSAIKLSWKLLRPFLFYFAEVKQISRTTRVSCFPLLPLKPCTVNFAVETVAFFFLRGQKVTTSNFTAATSHPDTRGRDCLPATRHYNGPLPLLGT
jgi:hypothetical protein